MENYEFRTFHSQVLTGKVRKKLWICGLLSGIKKEKYEECKEKVSFEKKKPHQWSKK